MQMRKKILSVFRGYYQHIIFFLKILFRKWALEQEALFGLRFSKIFSPTLFGIMMRSKKEKVRLLRFPIQRDFEDIQSSNQSQSSEANQFLN